MKRFIVTTCAGFTACVLLFSLFSRLPFMMPIDRAVIFQLFAMAVSIAGGMCLFDALSDKYDLPFLAGGAARMLICYLVVGIEGLAFGMLPLKWLSLAYISIIIIPAFAVTYAIVYVTFVKYARDINERIKMRDRGDETE